MIRMPKDRLEILTKGREMIRWTAKVYTNNITGTQRRTWRKTIETDDGSRVHCEVYELGGVYYWSANCLIFGRPDVSRLSWGTFAVTPSSLGYAKARATTIAHQALKSPKPVNH